MLALVLLGMMQTAAVQADETVAAPASPPCSVVNVAQSAPASLYLVCGTTATLLGNADQYQSSYNLSLDAFVVARQEGGQTHVSVVSQLSSGGTPHIDDISAEVLRAATGAFVDRGSASVDVASFASDGRIAVTAAPEAGRAAAAPAAVDVAVEMGRAMPVSATPASDGALDMAAEPTRP